jgi:hypothetical protein
MKMFSFWQKWIFVVGVLLLVFGVFMALMNGTSLFAFFDSQVNGVFWADGELPAGADGFQYWVYGVLGATVAGWGLFIAFISSQPFKRKERWSWTCLFSGTLIWFLLDMFISVRSKVYFNVAFNILVMLLIIIPLVATRSEFRESPESIKE